MNPAGAEPAADVAIVGTGPAGRRLAETLRTSGMVVALLGSDEPVWGIDDGARPAGEEAGDRLFTLHRSRRGVPSGSVTSRWVVLATGSVEAPVPARRGAAVPDSSSWPTGPRAESALGRSVGCSASWDRDAGGWLLDVDRRMLTSVPGILAIGGVVGALDASAALSHAVTATATLLAGRESSHPDPGGEHHDDALLPQRSAARPLGAPARIDPSDSLVICPCEGISLGEVRNRTEAYPVDPTARDTKLLTRLGMGECQGRVCGHLLAVLDEAAGRTPTPLQPRSPVHPLLIPSASRKDTSR